MTTIKNLTNSPHDLDTLDGPYRLAALETVDKPFDPTYLVALKGIGYFEIADGPPAHAPSLVSAGDADNAELIEAMTDEELRAFIEGRTGKAPHHNAKSETLIAQAKAAIEGTK